MYSYVLINTTNNKIVDSATTREEARIVKRRLQAKQQMKTRIVQMQPKQRVR